MVRLPSGHVELEYIESTGTQHIDTGFNPTNNTRVVLRMSTAQSGSKTVFGSDLSWTGNGFALGVDFAHYGTRNGSVLGLNDGTPHTLDFNKNVISLDGAKKLTLGEATFEMTYPMYLFCNNRAGTAQEHTVLRLYDCKIYAQDSLIQDLIPCKTLTGAVGLYDQVGGKFYGNSGTGSFVAGPEVRYPPDTPAELKVVADHENIHLEWTTVEDAIGYRIFRDDVQLAETTGTTYTDVVQKSGSYRYGVSAYNEYGVSDTVEQTVSVIIPITPPKHLRVADVRANALGLKWDTVPGALGYIVFRDGHWWEDTSYSTITDRAVGPNEAHTYSVRSYTEGQESDPVEITAKTLPLEAELELVTDRTSGDVYDLPVLTAAVKSGTATPEEVQLYLAGTHKGGYNVSDLNRVEATTLYVSERLRLYGYSEPIVSKLDWVETDWPTDQDFIRYFGNVSYLREIIAVWASTPATPTAIPGFTQDKANDLEKILLDLDQLISNMRDSWFYAGDLYAGEV